MLHEPIRDVEHVERVEVHLAADADAAPSNGSTTRAGCAHSTIAVGPSITSRIGSYLTSGSAR